MASRRIANLTIAAWLGLRNLCAADADGSREVPFLQMLKMELVSILPILIIGGGFFVLVMWYFRRQMKSPEYRTHLEHAARHRQHME